MLHIKTKAIKGEKDTRAIVLQKCVTAFLDSEKRRFSSDRRIAERPPRLPSVRAIAAKLGSDSDLSRLIRSLLEYTADEAYFKATGKHCYVSEWHVEDHLKTDQARKEYIRAAIEDIKTPESVAIAFADVFSSMGNKKAAAACESLAERLKAVKNHAKRSEVANA